ncbi:MAG: hypothetical protein A2Y15_08780 [Clostridiales bacterium GWF2_36_10]|nr:MAG: hypothetical protein A2Y15_08780 [Clostridiales bacterium GWF2_36_10]HAN20438.1 hypothetical protein [Clostridiales bacterium]
MAIDFPDNFPNIEQMLGILQKTIEKSWKIEIDIDDIYSWLNNFTGQFCDAEDEKRIALWILCNYTYYNPDDINHLCKILYKNFLHDVIVKNNLYEEDSIEKELKNVCFSSIGSASESGGLLLYHFRQQANISIDRFFYPTSIDSTSENIVVFIDDATLSGGTALRTFFKNVENIPYKSIYYLTIIASKEAVEKLSEKGINVIYCTLVDERNKCFSDASMVFYRFPELKDLVKNIIKNYGEIIEHEMPLGYKDGEYCFGFYYNTPNNSLPIFWSSNNWKPIFARKEKLQNAKQLHFAADRYI